MRPHAMLLAALLSGAVAHAAEPPPLALTGADHRGTVDDSGISWRTTYVLAHPLVRDSRLELAAPVPAAVTWEVGDAPVVPVRDGSGRVVALDVGATHGPVVVTTWEPLSVEPPGLLHPPLAGGGVLQRVKLNGATLDPSPALGAEHRLDHAQQPEIRNRERHRLDRALGPRGRTGALYLLGDGRVAGAGGLPATFHPAGAVSPGVLASVAGGFAVVVALMALAIRLLDRRARWERVEVYLRNELTPEAEEEQDDPVPAS